MVEQGLRIQDPVHAALDFLPVWWYSYTGITCGTLGLGSSELNERVQMRTRLASLSVAAALLIFASISSAVDRLVPSEYPSIQAAIDAAEKGDTVIISPGTYTGDSNRDIDFRGKAITVRSTDPSAANIVAATVIDCQGTQVEPHRGFYFHSQETTNSILAGLTIVNGYGPQGKEPDYYPPAVGGAVLCVRSGPTIAYCHMQDNNADAAGGGMYNYQA